MIKSALILVPHQDDDLNVAGCVIDQMIAADMNIYACFVTNGDYDGKEIVRAKEVATVAELLHYQKVFYLGYGDGGILQESLHFADEHTIVSSHSGYKETHGVPPFSDFHYEKYKAHNLYTKANLHNDIKDVLLTVKADLIFCIDKDSHPDHQLVSDLFDEILQEIIGETDYRPLVLKKFAYLGTWHGTDDYFMRPAKATECLAKKGNSIVTCATPHLWENRLQFAVNPALYDIRFWKSPLFHAYRMYKSQSGAAFFTRCCNADAVYWFFDTVKNEFALPADFPIEETPFSFFKADENTAGVKKYYLYSLLYRLYVLLCYKIPGKIKQYMRGAEK